MLHSELGPYGHVRFTLNGDSLFLPAKLAVSLALIFHELATNAVKYGSLSRRTGSIKLQWAVQARNGQRVLRVVWSEVGGPPVKAASGTGLGSSLIDKGIPGATVERELRRTGLVCTIELPLPGSAENGTLA